MKINIVIKKNLFPFCRNLLDTYLKPKAHNDKYTSKAICILKNLLKTNFYSLKYENNTHLDKHIPYLVIEMKTFNVP